MRSSLATALLLLACAAPAAAQTVRTENGNIVVQDRAGHLRRGPRARFGDGRERYIAPGNSLEAIPRGEYAGHLIVGQHRYFIAGGSYDGLWLLTPDGREVGPIRDESSATVDDFRETYVRTAISNRTQPVAVPVIRAKSSTYSTRTTP